VAGEIHSLLAVAVGTLWIGFMDEGAARLDLSGQARPATSPRMERLQPSVTHPEEPRFVTLGLVNGDIRFGTASGIQKLDASGRALVPDERFSGLFGSGTRQVWKFEQDAFGSVWMYTVDPARHLKALGVAVADAQGRYHWQERPLQALSGKTVFALTSEPDGVIWVGTNDGLYRHDPHRQKDYATPAATLLRNVATHGGKLLWGGAGRVAPAELDWRENSLRFDYAQPDFEMGAAERYQVLLDARIKAIEQRDRPPEPGDDILLSVITDGRHAAIDLRLVDPDNENEAGNKLNDLVGNALRIWRETTESAYVRPDGKPFELTGAAQMIFSDLGTIAVEKTRGFSAYRWIRDELVRLGVPASEIAFMQDFKKSEAKQRLFGDVRAGKVRFLIGSSETMGTGVNAQLRLKALHHLDVPWLPSQIEQREGRILRQGNQHDVVDIFAYATEGSMDAQMWQNNERKARFIAAALSGDTSIRRLDDMGEGQANQFAMAKAIASGDPRLMQKAGLEADIARLERLRFAHQDDQFAIRRQIRDAERDVEYSTRRIGEIGKDLDRLLPTAGNAFGMTVAQERLTERKLAGRALMKEILTLVQLQHKGECVIASIGGFELTYSGQRFGQDGYRYSTAMIRTGTETEIELPVTTTPLGAIARLEHVLAGLEQEQAQYRHRLSDAEQRLASYRARDGGEFTFSAELTEKRQKLGEIEKSLAEDIVPVGTRAAA